MTGASKPNLIRILEILQPYRVYAEGLKAFVESKYCTDHSAEHVMGFIFQHVKQLKAERKAKKKNALQTKAQQKTDADVEQAEGLLKNMLGNEVLEQEAKDREEDKDTKQNKHEKKVQSYLKQFDLKDIEDLASQDKDFLVQLGFSLDNGIDELHEKEFINGLKEYCKSFDLQNLNAQKIQLLTMVINAEYGECFDADPQKLNPVDLFWIRSVFFVYHGDWGEIMSLNYQSMKQVYQRYVKSKGGVGELDIGRLERIFRKEECKYFDVHTLDEIQLHQIVKVLNDEHGEHYDAANLSSDDKIWIKSVLLTYQGSRAVAMDKNYAELKQQFYTYLGLIGNSDNPEAEGVKMNLMYFLLGNKLNGWGISQDQIRETMQRQIEYTEYLNNAESIFRGVTIEKQQQIFNTLAEVTRTITLRKMHLNGIWIGAGEEYENTIKSMGYDHFNMVRACINDNASAGDILKSFHKPLVEIGCKYYLERVKLGKNIQGSIDEKNNDIQNLLNQIDRNYKEIVKSLQIDEENITPDQLFDATMSMNDEIYDKQKYIDNQKQRMDSDMLGYLRRQAALVKLEKGKYSFEHLQILLEVAKVTTPEAIRNTVGFDSREYISAQIREELQGAMEKYNPQSAEYLIFKMAVQGLLVLDNDKSQEIISNTLQEEGHNLNVVRQLIALESMGQDDKDSRKEFRGVEMLTTDRKKTRVSQQKKQEELMYSMKQETVKATMQLPVDMISGSSVDGIGVENDALDNTVNNYDDENVPRIVQIPGLGRMLLDVESVRLLESYGAYGDNAHFIQDGEQLVILGPVEKKSDYFADKHQVGREPVYKLSKKNICIAHADGSKIQLYNFDHTQTVTTLTNKSIGAYHMEQALMYQIEHHPFVHYMQDQLMPYINNNFGVAFRLLAEYAQEGRKPTRYIYEQIINDILGFKKYIPELKKYLSSPERTKLIGSLKEFGGKDNFDNPALANIVQMSNSMEDMVRLFDNENGGNAFMTFLDQKAFDFDGFDGWGQDVRQWLYDNGTVILITIAVATLFATGLGAPMGAMLGGGALATMGGSAIAGALGGMIGQRLGQFVDATVKNEIAAVQFGGEVGYVNPIDLEMFLSNDGLRKADGTKMGGWEFVGNLTQEFLGSAVQTFAFMGAGRIIGSSKQYLNLSKYIDDIPPTFTMNFGRLGVRTFGSQPLKDFLLKATRLHQMPPLPTEIEDDILKGFVKEFVGELKEEGIGIGIEKGTEGTVFSPLGDAANIYFSISPTGNPDITLKNISSPEDGKTQKITFEYESADPYKKTLLIQQFKANKFEQQKDGALIFTKTKDGKTTQVEYIQTNESIEQRGNKELITFFSGKDKDGKQLRKPIVRNPEGYYEGDFEYETTGTKGGLREVLVKVGVVKDNDLGYTVITKSGREIQVRMKKDDNQIVVEPEKKSGGGGGGEEEESKEDEEIKLDNEHKSSNGSSQFQTDPIDGSTEQLPPITPEAEKNATQDELVTMNQQLESELSKGDLPEGSDSSFSQKLSSLLVSVTAKLKSGKIFTENITKTIHLLQDIFHRSPDRISRNMLSNEAQEFCQTVLKVAIRINLPVELKYFIQSVYLSIISKNGEVRGAGEYMIRGGATVQHHYENKLSAATDSHIPKDDAGNPVYIMRDGSDIDIVKAKIGFVGAMEFMSSLFVGVPHLLKTPYFFGSDMKLPGDLDIDINSQDVFGDGGILERLQGDERVPGLKFIDKSTGKEVSGSINELIKNEEFMAQFETGGISIDFMIETDGVMVPVELFCNSADNKYSILGQGSNEKPILVLDNGLQVPSPELYVPYIEHITHKAIDQVDGSKPMDSKLVKRIWDYLETLQTVHVNSIASGETISITGYKIRQKILILFQKVVNKFGRGGLDDADATGDLAEKVVDVFGVNKDLLGNIVSDYKYIQNNLTPSPLPLPELQNRRIMIADIRANIVQSKQSNTPLDASIKQHIDDLTRYDFTDTAVGFAYYADYRILMNMDLSGVEQVSNSTDDLGTKNLYTFSDEVRSDNSQNSDNLIIKNKDGTNAKNEYGSLVINDEARNELNEFLRTVRVRDRNGNETDVFAFTENLTYDQIVLINEVHTMVRQPGEIDDVALNIRKGLVLRKEFNEVQIRVLMESNVCGVSDVIAFLRFLRNSFLSDLKGSPDEKITDVRKSSNGITIRVPFSNTVILEGDRLKDLPKILQAVPIKDQREGDPRGGMSCTIHSFVNILAFFGVSIVENVADLRNAIDMEYPVDGHENPSNVSLFFRDHLLFKEKYNTFSYNPSGNLDQNKGNAEKVLSALDRAGGAVLSVRESIRSGEKVLIENYHSVSLIREGNNYVLFNSLGPKIAFLSREDAIDLVNHKNISQVTCIEKKITYSKRSSDGSSKTVEPVQGFLSIERSISSNIASTDIIPCGENDINLLDGDFFTDGVERELRAIKNIEGKVHMVILRPLGGGNLDNDIIYLQTSDEDPTMFVGLGSNLNDKYLSNLGKTLTNKQK